MNYTYRELEKVCDMYLKSLSDDAKHQFLISGDMTFDMYVLSRMNRGDIVNIDYENNQWDFINSNKKQRDRIKKIKRLYDE